MARITFSSCYLFSELTKAQTADAISRLGAVRHTYPAGEVILTGDAFAKSLFFVESGTATVTRTVDGNPVLLNLVRAGGCFGAAALFGNCPHYPTTVRAKTRLSLLEIDGEALTALCYAYPQVAMAHIRFLSERIRFLNDKIDSLTGRTSESKLAKFLLTHSDPEGVFCPELTMKNVAASLDIGRASLYRLLSRLSDEGLIRQEGGTIQIINKTLLERLANPQ